MSGAIVYNAEPFGYSEKAVQTWAKKGFGYVEGSWDGIKETLSFPKVKGLIVRLKEYVNSDIINRFPNLKFVVSATTGHDHLDIKYLQEKGIILYSLRPHKEFLDTIPSTAEHTWALLMALLRNVPQANEDVKQGQWRRDLFRGNQLKGKVLGIVGLGRTGSKVAHYASAFNMQVIYFDPYKESEEIERCTQLSQLLLKSDVISLHVHLTEETESLIDINRLKEIKKGAYLINTSRGKVCDENALVMGLENGVLAGVASDVLSTELDELQSSPLWKAQKAGQRVIISPHIGGATWEAMWECEEFIVDTVEIFSYE